MKKSELKRALLGKNAVLSEGNVRRIIAQELQKADGDINMALVDACFAFLEARQKGKGAENTKCKKQITARKILPAAAAVIVLLAAVGGAYSLGFSQGQGKTAEDTETAAETAASASSYLEEQLLSYGISPVTLPAEMVSGACTVKEIKEVSAESAAEISLEVQFEYNGAAGSMAVENFSEDYPLDTAAAAAGAVSQQNTNINGTDIFIFEYESGCAVLYKSGAAIYNIYLECGIETAAAFAKTMK